MPKQFRSRRKDGRGHWPRGRRLHPDEPVGRWPRRSLLAVTVTRAAFGAQLGRDLARYCGANVKTLWRWKTGMDLPGPKFTKRLLIWAERMGIDARGA